MNSVLDDVRSQVADALDVPATEVDIGESLLDQGLDSIRLMGLVEKLREAGHDVDFADLAEDPRIAAWESLLTGGR